MFDYNPDFMKDAYVLIKKQQEFAGFILHACLFVLVNAGLVCLNLFYLTGFLWFIFPLAGWAIGLAIHGISLIFSKQYFEREYAHIELKAQELSRKSI